MTGQGIIRMRLDCLVLAGWLACAAATGQPSQSDALDRFIKQQREIDKQLERDRVEVAPIESLVDFQWGGWVDYFFMSYDDGQQESRVAHRPGTALWTRISIDGGAHEIFARMRLRYSYFRPGDEGAARQEDWFGPEFDQLWYQVDWGKALRLAAPGDPFQVTTRVGRQTVQFGTGFVLDLPMDAVLIDARLYDVRVQGLLGRAIRNLPNVVRDNAVESHSDRNFAGMQLSYEGWEQHVPFVYWLLNDDRTKERPKDPFQDYSYDSFYLGGGAAGEIVKDLRYWGEGVMQFGRSFGDGAWRSRDYIEAWGWNAGIEKLWHTAWRPRLSFEYMFGSGDADRIYNAVGSRGGNRSGTPDRGFSGFGFRDTGLALAPTVTNLHIFKVGGSVTPFEKVQLLREMELGTNWFLYVKNQGRGAISDSTADNFDPYVGWGMDYFVNWRLTSDLAFTIRCGTFFPGQAYSDQDTRYFLLTGLTWSF